MLNDEMEQENGQGTEMETSNGKKYATFSHTFTDEWAGKEVELAFRFSKPTLLLIKAMQKQAPRDSARAARNLLVNTIHPDDKAEFLTAAEEYPGVMTSFGSAVVKAVGIGEVGN